jgi:hypothetical protein
MTSSPARSDAAPVALAVVLSATYLAIVCFRPTGTVDLWWTLAVGDYIRAEGDVPRTALWTIAAVRDLPYVCHGWLGALAFSAVAAAFGLDAVPGLPTFVALCVFGVMVATSRRLGAPWLLAVAAADLVLFIVSLRMIARAEVFAYLWFALALNRIAAYLQSGRVRDLVWLLPIAVLWVNSHGSFPLLLALLLCAALGVALDAWRSAGFRLDALAASSLWRRSAVLGAGALLGALAAFANPYGLDLVRSIVEPAQPGSMTSFLEEWQPLHARGWLPARFLVPAILVIGAIAGGYRRMSFVSMLIAIAFSALAVSAERHITFFGIAAAFVLGDYASGLTLGRRSRAVLAAALPVALLGANAFAATELGFADRSLTAHPSDWITPRGLSFVRENVRGNVLNSYHLGGALIYFAYPQLRVSIDSRADPFPPDYYLAHRDALYGGPQATLAFADRHAIDHIVIAWQTYERRLRGREAELDGFRLVYADELTAVLSRPVAAP